MDKLEMQRRQLDTRV